MDVVYNIVANECGGGEDARSRKTKANKVSLSLVNVPVNMAECSCPLRCQSLLPSIEGELRGTPWWWLLLRLDLSLFTPFESESLIERSHRANITLAQYSWGIVHIFLSKSQPFSQVLCPKVLLYIPRTTSTGIPSPICAPNKTVAK